MMSFKEAVKNCLTKKYFTTSGRATRAEYWWFTLFWYALLIIPVFVGVGLDFFADFSNALGVSILISCIILLFTFIPAISVQVRRVHDVGLSGSFVFLQLVPMVGGFVGLLVLIVTIWPSEDKENEYGPNPNFQDDENGENPSTEDMAVIDMRLSIETTEDSKDIKANKEDDSRFMPPIVFDSTVKDSHDEMTQEEKMHEEELPQNESFSPEEEHEALMSESQISEDTSNSEEDSSNKMGGIVHSIIR